MLKSARAIARSVQAETAVRRNRTSAERSYLYKVGTSAAQRNKALAHGSPTQVSLVRNNEASIQMPVEIHATVQDADNENSAFLGHIENHMAA